MSEKRADISKIGYSPAALYASGWNLDALAASVKAASAAGQTPLITGSPSPWFPPEVTGGVPAYMQGGCNPPWEAGWVRVHIVDYDLHSPFGPEPASPDAHLPLPAQLGATPDQNVPYARLAEFWCKRGTTISIGAPGAMWRSAPGYYCGIPGHKQPAHGKVTEAHSTKLGMSLDGSFTYVNDGTGDVDEWEFFLLKSPDPNIPNDPDAFQPPKELTSQIRYDAETHSYCAAGKVPHIDATFNYELGWRVARLFGTSVIYEPPINEAQFPVYWPAQVGDPQDGKNCAPDINRLANEVIVPFMRGVLYAVPQAQFAGCEAAGPLDLGAIIRVMRQVAPSQVKTGTGHWYSWFTGPDLFGETVKQLGGFDAFAIMETDQYDVLVKRAQTDLPYITHVLGAGGQDGVAKAVVR